MSDNKTLDKLLDDIIDEAATIAAENLGKNMPEPESIEFSKELEEKMKKLFKRERNKIFLKKLSKYSKRVAIFFLVLTIASSITIFSVEAWRIKLMNFIIEMNQTHSQVNFGEDNRGDTYSSDEISLGYIPEGLKLEKSNVQEKWVDLVFKGEETYFIFSMNNIDGSIGIDTENAHAKKIMINGREALLSSNNNVSILVWHDDEFSYKISGRINEKEIKKIAENIIK